MTSVSVFPTPFDVGISFQCVEVTQLVSESLLEGSAPGVAIHSVCPWEKGKLRSFLHHHLGQSHP